MQAARLPLPVLLRLLLGAKGGALAKGVVRRGLLGGELRLLRSAVGGARRCSSRLLLFQQLGGCLLTRRGRLRVYKVKINCKVCDGMLSGQQPC